MKYNMSVIMKRAWEIRSEENTNMSSALKRAWAEAKNQKQELTVEEKIQRLEAVGFKRWTKGGIDRLYINAKELGLTCDVNKQHGCFNGKALSNSKTRAIADGKHYIDVADFTCHTSCELSFVYEAMEAMIKAIA